MFADTAGPARNDQSGHNGRLENAECEQARKSGQAAESADSWLRFGRRVRHYNDNTPKNGKIEVVALT